MRKLFAMLLALCFMCGAMTAVAEGTQEVTFGRATFQIPAEMVISASYEGGMVAAIGDTQFVIAVEDWATTYGIDLGDSDVQQWMNVYCFYRAAGEESDQASTIASVHTEENIGMPDKATVAYLVLDDGTQTMLSFGHAYGNYGFLFSLIAPTGADQQELLDMCKEVALSFRLDGMTAEEMTAAAEEAARIAAEQAAMQKYVVITNSSANIRSGPDGSAAKITTAAKGDTFPLIGEDGNWYMIDVNGQTGYVTKSLSAIKD